MSLQGEPGAHGAAGSPGLAVSVLLSSCVRLQRAWESLTEEPSQFHPLTALHLCTCRELVVAPEREVALALLDPLVLVVLMAILDPPDPLSVSASPSFPVAKL